MKNGGSEAALVFWALCLKAFEGMAILERLENC